MKKVYSAGTCFLGTKGKRARMDIFLILLCLYRQSRIIVSIQISLGKLQERRVTDRRKLEFISRVWLKPQTNKHARIDLWHLYETW